MDRETCFRNWAGNHAYESDAGWSEEVWSAAWDHALLEAAERIERMPFGDTAASFAAYLRRMSEE